MITTRVATPALAAVTLGLAACGGSTARSPGVSSRPTTLYTVSMTGAAEASNGAPQGRGVAIIAFHGDSRVCFRFAHLDGFVDATVAHINYGTIGRSGPVVLALSSGPKLHHRGCAAISPTLSRTIWRQPSAYYVNVHSRRYPGGAVRAQL
jgi:CHRD domain